MLIGILANLVDHDDTREESKMITTTDLIGALERNLDTLKSQTQGLTHADSVLQLPFCNGLTPES